MGKIHSIAPGIVSFKQLDDGACESITNSLQDADWHVSTIAKVRGFSRIETPMTELRSSHSIGDEGQSLFRETIQKLESKSLSIFQQEWGIRNICICNPQFTKYGEGDFIKKHTDSGAAFPKRLCTAVTYLTDDYVGGEIGFPNIELNLKPTKGETLIFPSDLVHEVFPITKGVKIVFVFFIEFK